MKKILFLLLLSVASYGQTSTGQEQEFDYGIKNNSLQTITTPTYIGTFGTDGTQGKIPSAYIEKTDNKQNSLAIDGTGVKYPTVDAVNAALPKNYAIIVYVNSTNPNTATIFDTANPPITNNNALKTDINNLYIGTDASTWVYDGTIFVYVTKTVPQVSNFFLSGSSTDAGNDKIQAIKRNGTIESTGFIKTSGTSSQFLKANGSSDSTAYQPLLVSATNIKTINSTSLLGSGDISTILPVVETGTSFSLTDSYNGKVVILTASCTVTIPNGLVAGFECSFVTLAGVTQTIALGGSVVLFNNAGTTMAEKLSFTLKNRTATNNYITVGSL